MAPEAWPTEATGELPVVLPGVLEILPGSLSSGRMGIPGRGLPVQSTFRLDIADHDELGESVLSQNRCRSR